MDCLGSGGRSLGPVNQDLWAQPPQGQQRLLQRGGEGPGALSPPPGRWGAVDQSPGFLVLGQTFPRLCRLQFLPALGEPEGCGSPPWCWVFIETPGVCLQVEMPKSQQ